MRFRPNLAGTLATLFFAPLLFSLANWQYQRGGEKQALFERFDQQAEVAPVALASILADAELDPDRLRFQPITFEPQWQDQAPLILLQNRIHRHQTGIWLYRVARLAETGQLVLVNHGWLPTERGSHVPIVAVPEPAQGRLQAQLAPYPQVGLRLGDVSVLQAEDGRLASPYIDAELAEAWLGEPVLGLTLQLSEASPVYVRDWRPDLIPPERHYGYALQWFSLFVTLLVIFLVMGLRRGRRLAQEQNQ